MKPSLTFERFEHELLKLKTQFPPTHTGPAGFAIPDGVLTRYCIVGQVLVNMGVADLTQYDLGLSEVCDLGRTPLGEMVHAAMRLNDRGMPWHAIIDRIVPQTPALEAPAPEPELAAV